MSLGRRNLLLGVVALAGAGFAIGAIGESGAGTFGAVGSLPNRVIAGPDRDVPCSENTNGIGICATPLPTLTAAETARRRPLEVVDIRIPVDADGPYRVLLGGAVLPRGLVEATNVQLGSAIDATYVADSFRIVLEDASTGRVLPDNIYVKGLVAGDQRVNAYLVFTILSHEPGAYVDVLQATVK